MSKSCKLFQNKCGNDIPTRGAETRKVYPKGGNACKLYPRGSRTCKLYPKEK